jgi:hypothetical protein
MSDKTLPQNLRLVRTDQRFGDLFDCMLLGDDVPWPGRRIGQVANDADVPGLWMARANLKSTFTGGMASKEAAALWLLRQHEGRTGGRIFADVQLNARVKALVS